MGFFVEFLTVELVVEGMAHLGVTHVGCGPSLEPMETKILVLPGLSQHAPVVRTEWEITTSDCVDLCHVDC